VQNPDLSLILACYNEETILEKSLEEIIKILDSATFTYEIILVDDCSRDETRKVIHMLLLKYKERSMRKIFHEKNMGRGRTVTDGFRIARGDIVGFIDVDLEVHARYIPSFVLAIKKGADVALGSRKYKLQLKPAPIYRYLLSRGYAFLVRKMLKIKLTDTECGFKFFKRMKIFPILDETENQRWFWDTEVMARAYYRGLQIVEIPCIFSRRSDKPSTVRLIPDVTDYFRELCRFRKHFLRKIRNSASLYG